MHLQRYTMSTRNAFNPNKPDSVFEHGIFAECMCLGVSLTATQLSELGSFRNCLPSCSTMTPFSGESAKKASIQRHRNWSLD